MTSDPTSEFSYAMGRSTGESARLRLQATIYDAATAALITAAGVGPGQRVLDLGCGAGDVTLALARAVGSAGSVIAIDNDPAMIALARGCAAEAGLDNIAFELADVQHPPVEPGSLDAVVGRLIMVHLASPAEALAGLLQLLRPGGTILTMEFNTSRAQVTPPTPSYTATVATIDDALRRVGADPDLGLGLPSLFRDAGLADPKIMAITVATGDTTLASEYATQTIQSLWPIIARHDESAPGEYDLVAETDRLDRGLRSENAFVYFPELVGVWSTVG